MTQLQITPTFTKRYGDVADTKADGATYTPRELAEFVASQMIEIADSDLTRPIRLLDPAVGHGELLHSLLERLEGDVEVFGFETDDRALAVTTERLGSSFPRANLRLVHGSFLDHVLEDFAEGLFSKATHRYDLVIANPPYVRTQIMGADRAQLLARQFGLSGRVDLYHAFLLGIMRVLSPSGTAGIIVSNRFMTTRGGSNTRKALLNKLRLQRVFDLGDTKLFEAAVLPAVLVAQGLAHKPATPPSFVTIYECKNSPSYHVTHPLEALEHEGVSEIADGRRFCVAHGQLDNGGDEGEVWRLASLSVDRWMTQVATHTADRFGDIGKIRVGVKTTADKVFIPKNWTEDLELLRPLTTHHVARRFRPHPLTRQILYPHEVVGGRRQAVTLDHYPRSRAYLEKHRAVLEARTYVIDGGRKWYEIWVAQDPAAWAAPKLVFRDISERPMFWMDLTGSVVNGDCYWLTGPEESLWLALAIANSTFIERFYDRRFNNKLYAGRRRFITQYVEQFPMPDPESSLAREIIRRSRALYEQPDDSAGEEALDALVWRSFGVSREEG